MSTKPLPDQYTQDLEKSHREKTDRIEALETEVADKEICIAFLEWNLEAADKRIKTLEDAIKGPVF